MTTFVIPVLLLGVTLYAWYLIRDREHLEYILSLTEEKNRLLKELADRRQLYISELEKVIDKQQKVNSALCKDIQITAKNIYAELQKNHETR